MCIFLFFSFKNVQVRSLITEQVMSKISRPRLMFCLYPHAVPSGKLSFSLISVTFFFFFFQFQQVTSGH